MHRETWILHTRIGAQFDQGSILAKRSVPSFITNQWSEQDFRVKRGIPIIEQSRLIAKYSITT